jgi:glycosyltransferase involved in cell wall biosynthesis
VKRSRDLARLAVETKDHNLFDEVSPSTTTEVLAQNNRVPRPLFSIIVPTYNEERFLPGLLESIRHQKFQNYEVIIADDSSTDLTQSIARSYGARIINNEGIGEYPSRNAAAREARGSILVFTGADTLMPPNLLMSATEKFERDPTLAGIYCPTYPYDAPIWAKLEFAIFHVLNTLIYWFTREANASTAFLAIRSDIFRKTDGFQDTCFGDSTYTRQISKNVKLRPCLDMVIFVSGRRTKMGLKGFNRHHLGLVMNVMFRPLRNMRWLRAENEYRNKVHSRSNRSAN